MSRRWLITGASGLLGRSMCARLVDEGDTVLGVRRSHPVAIPGVKELIVDLETARIDEVVVRHAPSHVLHAAALTDVDACERDEERARMIHVEVTTRLAAASVRSGARFVHVSTDHLWDGSQSLVSEDTPPTPINAYGRTKAAGEGAVLTADPRALVVRTNFFGRGPQWHPSLSDWIVSSLVSERAVGAFADVHFTPLALPLLCELILDLVDRPLSGVLHLAGRDRLSKFDFACLLADALDLDAGLVERRSVRDADLLAARPADMSLDTTVAANILGRPLPGVLASISAVLPDYAAPDLTMGFT